MRPDGRPLSTGRSAQALAPQMQAKNITAVCRLENSKVKLDMSRALEMIAGQRTRMLNQLSWKEMTGGRSEEESLLGGGQEQREEDEDTPLIED